MGSGLRVLGEGLGLCPSGFGAKGGRMSTGKEDEGLGFRTLGFRV